MLEEAFTELCSWYLTTREDSMNTFFEHHKNNIRFSYRCFDRILLNGLDPAVSATGAGSRILQFLSGPVSGQPDCPHRHCRSVPQLGNEPVSKVECSHSGGSSGSA